MSEQEGNNDKDLDEIKRILRVYRRAKKVGVALFAIVVIGTLGYFAYNFIGNHIADNSCGPAPAAICKEASFTVYIPQANKLPVGYKLDTQSFSYGNQAVIYQINYGNNQHLAVSEEIKPSASDITAFYRQHMPLAFTSQTSSGTVTIGVINNEAVASLPTNTNTWILIAGPLDVSQATLKQTAQALTRVE